MTGSFSSFATTHLAEAQSHLSNSYCEHRLAARSGAAIGFAHNCTSFGGQVFNTLTYGTEVEVTAEGFDGFYMLEMPIRGGVEVEIGRQQVASERGRALCLSPGRQLRSRWRAETYQLMLQISREAVAEAFERRAHRPMGEGIIFDPVVDLTKAHGRALSRAMRELAALAARAEGCNAPGLQLRVDEVVDLLVSNLPYFEGRSLVPERLFATPTHVRHAMMILRRELAHPVSIAELAQRLGVSERALYEGFERYYQTPPYEILTRLRMEAARPLVREGTEPLSRIAERVGMPHQGRFSAQYKNSFGVLPRADRRAARCTS
ncbi:AraC family transcriptional regulator [Roseicyclus sp. F158]|uniref:AraC family transcriptional regulator n=1 Tax=Tropicimonas omnivorans TaxID=3075590 RepID=A0ABU3DFA8_9RHOB|nr:AraC family transcriptional regulator [Roseicyclus sp. F158]MDT0682400.1 AraC family transcriptional regulator [Roseicyclus sp. F158]